MIEGLRRDVTQHLISLYPRDYNKLSRSNLEYSIRVVAMGRKYQIPLILPAAFYYCCCLPLSEILHGTKDFVGVIWQLSFEDMLVCLQMRDDICDPHGSRNPYAFMNSFPLRPYDCSNPAACDIALTKAIQFALASGLFSSCELIFESHFTDPKILMEEDETSSFCLECTMEWSNNIRGGQRKLWQDLPEMLALPTWKAMLAEHSGSSKFV